MKRWPYRYCSWTVIAALVLAGAVLLQRHPRPSHAQQDGWTFAHVVIDPAPPATYRMNDLQIGDIDRDGLPDLWTTGRGAGAAAYQMVWYKNPTWTRYPIAPGDFKYGTLADVDADGDLDVVVDTSWFENTGRPQQPDWPRHPLGIAITPDWVQVGDLNGDGRLDVVLYTKQKAYWLPGPADPRGKWTAYLLATQPLQSGGSLADLDRDGDLDVIWGNAWLENTPAATSGPWPFHRIDPAWPTEARSTSGDIDGDGRLDVLLSGEESLQGVAWYSAPAGSPAQPWVRHDVVRQNYQGLHSLQVADFDRDGDLDIFTAEMHTGRDPDQVTVFENAGAGSQWIPHVLDTIGSHNAKVGDLNGDGYPDIAGKNYQAEKLPLQVDVWFNGLAGSAPATLTPTASATPEVTLTPSTTPAATEPAPAPGGTLPVNQWQRTIIDAQRPWRAIFIDSGDINGDGLPDIVGGGWWYQNPGSPAGSWLRHPFGGDLYNMAVIYDFDGDGDLDVLGTNGRESSSVFMWGENDGAGNFTLHRNLPQGQGDFLQGAAAAQLIPGGNVEVVLSWHNRTSTQMFQVPLPPAGDWLWSVISPTTSGEQVAIGDIDRDGDLDLHLGRVWLRNNGGVWTAVSALTLGDPDADPDRVKLADIDGDGDLDVVIAAEHANWVVWGEAPTDPTQPWTEHLITRDSLALSMDVGDIDRDGDPDVVIGEHVSNGRVIIFQNENGGRAWTGTVIDSGFEHHVGTHLVDIDRDGDLDIISTGWNHSRVALYENRAITGGSIPAALTPTFTPTVPSATPTIALSETPTPAPSLTSTEAPAATETSTATLTPQPSATPLPSETPTLTPLPSATPTDLPTAAPTATLPLPPDPSTGRILDGLQVLYTFEESGGNVVHDVSGAGEPLDLLIGDTSQVLWLPGGLSVTGPAAIQSPGPATRLSAACQATNEITIEAWITPANTTQYGPARIVTLSSDFEHRSFTLGQGWTRSPADFYDVRLRTTTTTTNGKPSLASRAGTLTPQLTHVLYTRSVDGTTRLYLNGVEQATGSSVGDFSPWDAAYRLALGDEIVGARTWRGDYYLVAIYSRALTPAEVMQNFSAGPGTVRPPSYLASPTPALLPSTTPTTSAATAETAPATPAPEIPPAAPVIVESDAPQVSRTGSWTPYPSDLASGGSYLYSSGSPADTLSLSFGGTSVEVIYVQHPALGSFTVELDGVPVQTISSTAPQSALGARLSIAGLTPGAHTLRILPASGAIAVDAFVVESVAAPPDALATPTPAEITPEAATLTPAPSETPTDLPTATAAPLPVLLPFYEPFDSGQGWAAQGAWRPESTLVRGGLSWYADSTARGQNSTLTYGGLVDLTAAQFPQLSVWVWATLAPQDVFAVEVSPDGGVTWLPLEMVSGLAQDWTLHALDLAPYRGAVIALRFRLDTTAALPEGTATLGVALDDLLIQEAPPPAPTLTETPTETPAATLDAAPAASPTDPLAATLTGTPSPAESATVTATATVQP